MKPMTFEIQVPEEKRGPYTKETAEKYTAGQERFFCVDGVTDGATIAMTEAIERIRETQPIDRLADIGAGSNRDYLRTWLQSSGAQEAIGVEPSVHMRELSDKMKQGDEPITVIPGDWEKTNVPDASVDLVVSRFSLHHLRDIRRGYAELARILKPGGQAVISLPHPDYCREELRKKNEAAVEGKPMSVQVFDTALHYYYHELESYIGSSLAGSGLELVETKSFNWGTKDVSESAIPNTLLFVIKKK